MTPALAALEPELATVPGVVSTWFGRPELPPVWCRHVDSPHYAASMMKLAVMAAAYRLADAGRLDLDADVDVHAEFASATGTGHYRNSPGYDNDDQPWEHLDGRVPLRWLIRRMIVRSSNLATNLVLEQVGRRTVSEVWDHVGARHSVVGRGIEDYAAAAAGQSNLVTAADLAALFAALSARRLSGVHSDAEMLDVLLAQEVRDDVVRGLPAGTRVAHKNGWVDGIRHSAALVLPHDAPDFLLVTCISAPIGAAAGRELLARIAAAAWADRHLGEL